MKDTGTGTCACTNKCPNALQQTEAEAPASSILVGEPRGAPIYTISPSSCAACLVLMDSGSSLAIRKAIDVELHKVPA
eukprot:scaffold147825_cov28-Tisochrysis_lutea.AAC.2